MREFAEVSVQVHRARSFIHALGLVMAFAGIAFVAWRFHDFRDAAKAFVWTSSRVLAVTGLIAISTAANLLLPLAWRLLLAGKGTYVTKRWAIGTYGVSQLARYLPGNVLHYASRQALSVADGVPAWRLARVAIAELALVAIAGALTASLAAPLLIPALSSGASLLLFFCLNGMVTTSLWRLISPSMARAYLGYLLYVCWSAGTFAAILSTLVARIGEWPVVEGTYASAWLIGLLTPGAPAGMGVRESVSVALLGQRIEHGPLLSGLVGARIIGIAADVVTFCIAWAVRRLDSQDAAQRTGGTAQSAPAISPPDGAG